ncbi:hypothetical protein LJR232_003099 [Aquipseudomonas alcaligenes]
MSHQTQPRHSMFYDWVKAYQDFPFELPLQSDIIVRRFDAETEELLSQTAPAFFAEGSYCTSFRIHVCGRRLTIDGNPSRLDRLDNVFGLSTLDDCMRVINALLISRGLPAMTRCTTVQRTQEGDAVVDGAVFQRLDLTSNFYVGQGNERAYLRAISSQRYRNSIAYLYPDGNTCVWTPKGGEKAGRLVYPGNYAKAAELDAHLLPKVKRAYGEDSDEYRYVRDLRDWCQSVGMVRSELKCRNTPTLVCNPILFGSNLPEQFPALVLHDQRPDYLFAGLSLFAVQLPELLEQYFQVSVLA